MRRIVVFLCTIGIWLVAQAQDRNFVDQPNVQRFINDMVQAHHFSRAQLVILFKQLKMRPKVVRIAQASSQEQPWTSFQMIFINKARIEDGVRFWNKYQAALQRAEQQYGVPASIIVATIGVESKYGADKGQYVVAEALANLAFNNTGVRANFFRKELEEFLLLAREKHLDPLKVKGSFAGAIGQPQFMPSSYRHYAVNFSGSSIIDLSNNEVDVIGSVANYYHLNGWHANETVAIPANNPGSSFFGWHWRKTHGITLADLTRHQMVPELKNYHNKKYNTVLLKPSYGNEYWLVFHNFEVIKRYNHSVLYAMAVYHLSYYITAQRRAEQHAS